MKLTATTNLGTPAEFSKLYDAILGHAAQLMGHRDDKKKWRITDQYITISETGIYYNWTDSHCSCCQPDKDYFFWTFEAFDFDIPKETGLFW